MYTGKDRSIFYGTLVQYNSSIFAVQLNPADPADDFESTILPNIKLIQANMYTKVLFHPVSPAQRKNAKGVELICNEDLFKTVTYLAVVRGVARGTFRAIKTEQDLEQVECSDILLLSFIPNQLPPCAAVITSDILPPLCHVSLLCQNRNTPLAYIGAQPLNRLQFFDCMEAQVIIDTSYFGYAPHRLCKMSKLNKQTTVTSVKVTKPMHSNKELVTIQNKVRHSLSEIGAKAYQLFQIQRDDIVTNVDKSFVIPFSWYVQATANIVTAQDKYTSDDAKKISAAIMNCTVPQELIEIVLAQMATMNISQAIFRSSTNAEDLAGFNGAGLYVSKVVKEISAASVENAIRLVWASLWSKNAVMEREYFHMHSKTSTVAMAILVQPYLDQSNIIANGVCLTRNPIVPDKIGCYVCSYPGTEVRATDYKVGYMPEQLIVHQSLYKGAVDFELYQMCSTGEPVLSEPDAALLSTVASDLHKQVLKTDILPNNKQAMDIEFLIRDAGTSHELIILQARPFTIPRTDVLVHSIPKNFAHYYNNLQFPNKQFDLPECIARVNIDPVPYMPFLEYIMQAMTQKPHILRLFNSKVLYQFVTKCYTTFFDDEYLIDLLYVWYMAKPETEPAKEDQQRILKRFIVKNLSPDKTRKYSALFKK